LQWLLREAAEDGGGRDRIRRPMDLRLCEIMRGRTEELEALAVEM
jgi:hypothetical protein